MGPVTCSRDPAGWSSWVLRTLWTLLNSPAKLFPSRQDSTWQTHGFDVTKNWLEYFISIPSYWLRLKTHGHHVSWLSILFHLKLRQSLSAIYLQSYLCHQSSCFSSVLSWSFLLIPQETQTYCLEIRQKAVFVCKWMTLFFWFCEQVPGMWGKRPFQTEACCIVRANLPISVEQRSKPWCGKAYHHQPQGQVEVPCLCVWRVKPITRSTGLNCQTRTFSYSF